MKKQLLLIVLFICMLLSCGTHRTEKNKGGSEENETGALQALQQEIEMTKDPSLGYVPTQRLLEAKNYSDQLLAQSASVISNVSWHNLGPRNVGGRTRALLVDANDLSGSTVFAASVGGGIWRTTNISAVAPDWAPVNDLLQNLAVTCLAQDPSNAFNLYAGTGEGYFNIDAIQGLGIWKSADGGLTWNNLVSTANPSFYFCQRVVVNSTGVVFAATSTGLYRSSNGGASWVKVLGTGLGITGANSDFCYDVDLAANGDLYASLDGSIHKSTNGGVTWGAAMTIPITVGRVELACAPSNANVVYALCESSGFVAGILQSTNAGTSWLSRSEPDDADTNIPNTDFSRGQAWYDLSIAVDPTNASRLFVGAVDVFVSNDGAGTWSQVTHWYGGFGFQNVHADQHLFYFRPGSSSEAYITNDGGIYRTTNAGAAVPTFTAKELNYTTAQYYACAMHPDALSFYFLAGSQDNGTHRFTQPTYQDVTEVTGGDGAFCHIDQDQPQYQFTSYVQNIYFRSTDGGGSWSGINISDITGRFINPTDYDDQNNHFYACWASNQYLYWANPQSGNTTTVVNMATLGGNVSAIKVSPNTANRVFFATGNGRLVRADNANTATPTATLISTGLPFGYISCVEVENGDDNHLLVTYASYGVNSIWESFNGGTSWTSVEGNLPDMPVRWIILNPSNNTEAAIATELGVWTTAELSAGITDWGPSNDGLANVRVDMLQVRSSDKMVIAASHGRGLFYSDMFADPTALFSSDINLAYTNRPVQFTSTSLKATSWNWNFGDGGTSTAENPSHSFATPGKYNITLSINGGASVLTKTAYIHILPNRGTPYLVADGGGFETNTDDFGVITPAGTAWERGNSAISGKNGTHGGANAWVTGLTATAYADDGETSLQTPNYNFTAAGTYTLSFWTKFDLESDYDGFRVEYSLNKGTSWAPVGTTVVTNWYNSANILGTTSFPANEAFFSGNFAAFTQRTRDVSFLAGNANVAFRIIFRSDNTVNFSGAAIDDFQVSGPPNQSLPLSLVAFSAAKQQQDVLVKWTTENEQNVSRFIVERSTDGSNFIVAGTIAARNNPRDNYQFLDRLSALPNRPAGHYYYRLRSVDIDNQFKLSNIARVSFTADPRIEIAPNPVTSFVNIYTGAPLKQVSLYDMNGKLLLQTRAFNGNRMEIPSAIPAGQYLLKVETVAETVTRKLVKQ